jgi:hypothetical protein
LSLFWYPAKASKPSNAVIDGIPRDMSVSHVGSSAAATIYRG